MIERARRRETESFNGIPESVLRDSQIYNREDRKGAYSTSNQFGVMIVAVGSIDL
jgi:hypothetical protein